MARTARVVIEHIPHHIVQRGNRNQIVFFSDEDKQRYLALLREQARHCGVQIWGYCLMDTHVHLIAVPAQARGLAQCLAETHKRYTRMINFRKGWRGFLWQGRFSSYSMDEPYLYAAMRYVERNPVAAGMVTRAEAYHWSSARAHVFKVADAVLSPCYLEEQIADWAAYLRSEEPKQTTRIAEHLRTGRPLGNEMFVQRLEEALGRGLRVGKRGPKPRRTSHGESATTLTHASV